MKELTLLRNAKFGQVFMNEELLCYTIDPHILTNGVYTLALNYSPKFKTNLPHLYNDEFIASRGFRIHAGNTLKDSDGCILVGDKIDYKYTLYDSRKALRRLISTIKENDIWRLIITGK